MGKIVYNNNLDNLKAGIPLTADIQDENSLNLAYNVLRNMIENGAKIQIAGTATTLSDPNPIGRETLAVQADRLYASYETEDGIRYEKLIPDPEWYGADARDPNAKGYTVNVGVDMNPEDLKVVRPAMPNSEMVQLDIGPVTDDITKANAILNFLYTGIDDDVFIQVPVEADDLRIRSNKVPVERQMVDVIRYGNPSGVMIFNKYDSIEHSDLDPHWTETKGPEFSYDPGIEPKYEVLTKKAKTVYRAGNGYVEQTDTSYSEGEDPTTVYQIRALKDFGDVKAGDLGGFVESTDNLSQTGRCWVYDNAVVYGNAVVKDNAVVSGDAVIKENAVISDMATVFGQAEVRGSARISGTAGVGYEWDGVKNKENYQSGDATIVKGHAVITGNASVFGEVIVDDNAMIRDQATVKGRWPNKALDNKNGKSYYICAVSDNAVIEGSAIVENTYVTGNGHVHECADIYGHLTAGGHATVKGNAEVFGNAVISNNVTFTGNAKVHGFAVIPAKVTIGADADITARDDYFSLKPAGKNSYGVRNQEGGITVVHAGKSYHSTEEFQKSVLLSEEAREAVNEMETHFAVKEMGQDFAESAADDFTKAVESIPTEENGMEQ